MQGEKYEQEDKKSETNPSLQSSEGTEPANAMISDFQIHKLLRQ